MVSFSFFLTILYIYHKQTWLMRKILISEKQLNHVKKILSENPDSVLIDDYIVKASVNDSDSISFTFDGNKAYVGYNEELFWDEKNSNIPEYKQQAFDTISVYVKRYYQYHLGIGDFYDFLGERNSLSTERELLDYPGRFWFNRKIISFWKYPNKNDLSGLLNLLSKEVNRLYGISIDFNNYKIDINPLDDKTWDFDSREIGTLINIKDYNGSENASNQELTMIHILPSDKKKNTPQMVGVRNANLDILANKFNKNISQAEWNSAKNKFRGESVENNNDLVEDINIPVTTGDTVMMGKFKNKKTVVKSIDKDKHGMPTINGKQATTFRTLSNINEIKSSEINLNSFTPKKELNSKFWVNKKINSKVRRRLLKIADDFLDFTNLDSKYCKDILFLGSLCNYNWSKYSDIDLHILVDFKKINNDFELVKDYFDSKRKIWNNEHESLKIYGFQVELYIQDINEDNMSSGVFSLENNKWIKFPDENQTDLIDKSKIKQKSADIITKIDKLQSKYDKKPNISELEDISKQVKKIYDNIKKLRKSGLESKDGENSIGNIVFKVLRRSGHINMLVDLKRNTYDKINSIK